MPVSSSTSLPSSTQLARSIERGNLVEAGRSGESVREAQRLLTAQGFRCDVDGDFGMKTRAQVQAFQRSRGIEADGIIGPNTLRELRTPTAGVDRRQGSDAGLSARPQDRIPGQTGADFQRRAQADDARRRADANNSNNTGAVDNNRAGNDRSGGVTLAPAGATNAQKYEHYRQIILRNGGQDPRTSDKPVVLGVRGIDVAGHKHETTNRRAYDDTFVVLTRDGRVTELTGNTHAGQATSSLVSSVGMIRSGNFDVAPNGVRAGKDMGLPSFHVRTTSGSGNIPGIRDRSHDGRFSDAEIARRDTMTEILFHPGTADSPHSIGCQTLPPDAYRRFLNAVGSSGFSYTLVDANGRT